MKPSLLIAPALGFFLAVNASLLFGQASTVPYSVARAEATTLVARMTLAQKIAQVHGIEDQAKDIYRIVPAIPSLGIPALRVTNGPAGVGPGNGGEQKRATALPAPILLAASWNPAQAYTYGKIAGEETRDLGYNLLEAPDVNIARTPQSGRTFEGLGEDPFLTSEMGVSITEGIQSTGVMANVKHFVANNQETGRGSINEIVGARALHEIYLPAFRAAVEQGKVASLMCAYPQINGAFNCQNRPLLWGVLRGEWHFQGFVTSDFGAVHSTVPSVKAGLDLEMPTGRYFGSALQAAVESGKVSVRELNAMLVRRYTKMIEMGWFGPQPAPRQVPILADAALARQIADSGIVLLKNQNQLLPLDRNHVKSVALIGPYAIQASTGGGGSSEVIPFFSVSPDDGIQANLISQTPTTITDGSNLAQAVKDAQHADVAIVIVGDDDTEGRDQSLVLGENQNELIAAVAKANPRTIVVLKTGSAVLMPWLDSVSAVVEAWYPGEEDGNALADVLFGNVNPSGKLPITFPASVEQTLARNPRLYPGNGKTVYYSEGLDVGYRGYQASNQKPLFPFGFGLSYTTFAFHDLKITPNGGQTANVTFTVTNTGKRSGAEVAQLYLAFPSIAEGNEPPLQLKGFSKVALAAGASQTVTLTLDAHDFSYWSTRKHAWTVAAGQFGVRVGDSSADLPLSASFQVQ